MTKQNNRHLLYPVTYLSQVTTGDAYSLVNMPL